jgi:hypothetical protein
MSVQGELEQMPADSDRKGTALAALLFDWDGASKGGRRYESDAAVASSPAELSEILTAPVAGPHGT